jgi:hypothetical protein
MALYDSSDLYDLDLTSYDGTAITTYQTQGIHGHSFANGTDELWVVWNKVPKKYSSGWVNAPVQLTGAGEVFFESFLDGVFMVDGTDSNYFYDGSNWSTSTNLADSPKGKYIKEHLTRLYLFNVVMAGTTYNSRACYSDYPKNGAITWGLETGSDLEQTASSAVVTSAGSLFKTRNIKVGDPFTISTGTNAGEYVVLTVDSETQITLTANLVNTQSAKDFWVGGNWFDVGTDDGDIGMGIGETYNEIFLFKKSALYRYSAIEKQLRKVKTAPGTTSQRSIVGWGGYVYWYHPSGLYKCAGLEEEKISDPIEDIIEGVPDTTAVVTWVSPKDDTINFYLGNVTTRDGDEIQNCVAIYDINTKKMAISSIKNIMRCAVTWLEDDDVVVHAADNSSGVFKMETGTDFNGVAISFEAGTHPIYPAGTEAINIFTRLRAYIDNGPDVQLLYKLVYKPVKGREDVWINDHDWKPLKGAQMADRSEWSFPVNSVASGVKIKAIESSTGESFLIKKLVIYYSTMGNR